MSTPATAIMGGDFAEQLERVVGRAELKMFLDHSPALLSVSGFDGVFRQLNATWQTVLGYSLEELKSRPFIEFVHPDDRERTLDVLGQMVEQGTVVEAFENRYFACDGTIRWLSWAAVTRIEGELILALAHDVTAKREMEQALRTSESLLRSVIDTMAEGLVVQDEKGFITTHNKAAEDILGLTSDQLHGRTSVDPRWRSVHEDGSAFPGNEHPAMVALRTGGRQRNVVMGVHKPDETLTWLSINAEPMFSDVPSRVHGVVTTFHDMTSYKRASTLKDEFVSTVSHELRTPLTALKGALSLFQHNGGDATTRQMLLDVAMRNSDRLLHLIDDLLDVATIEAGKVRFDFALLELSELVHVALLCNQPYAAKHKVETRFKAEVEGTVWGDRQRLLQVLANVLSNACKFSPPHATIDVTMSEHGDYLRVTVADVGPGISEAYAPQVFEKFSQADGSSTRAQGGTGLGLAISKALVDRHGGVIGFEPNKPQGTRFFVDLPRHTSGDPEP